MSGGTDDILGRYEQWRGAFARSSDSLVPAGLRADCHVHVGIDAGSGLEMTFAAIDEQMRQACVDRAVLIPLNASDGYHRTNMALAQRVAESDGRFRSLYRLDPRDGDLRAHVQAGFDAGVAGLKIHPVSDGVGPLDPRIGPALELAERQRAVVLVHTGVDVEHASLDTVECARRYPGAQFVIGHVAVDALEDVAEQIAELDNVRICTAWWGPLDLALAMSWSHPSRFVLGSDPPYGAIPLGVGLTSRVARCVGWSDDDLLGVLGGNIESAMRGEGLPADRGVEGVRRDAGFLLADLPVPFRRCYMALVGAGANVSGGGDSGTHGLLAQAALRSRFVPEALRELADEITELVDLARDLEEAGHAVPAYVAYAGALTLTLTGPVLADLPVGLQTVGALR